ncbi:MAG TPA: hypothetical protein VKE74_35570, partial [Gemmataceae bacterium]|nr:hypothetical protein [Gemmataceae bacterium]
AAALRPQLRKLPEMTARRLENVQHLLRLLMAPGVTSFGSGWEGEAPAEPPKTAHQEVRPPNEPLGGRTSRRAANHENGSAGASPSQSQPAYYKLGLRFDPDAFGLSREVFVKAVRAEGVAFDAGFNALHVNRSPSRFRAAGELTHATAAHHGCVVLHHPVLSGTLRDAQQVAEAVAKVHRHRELLSSA